MQLSTSLSQVNENPKRYAAQIIKGVRIRLRAAVPVVLYEALQKHHSEILDDQGALRLIAAYAAMSRPSDDTKTPRLVCEARWLRRLHRSAKSAEGAILHFRGALPAAGVSVDWTAPIRQQRCRTLRLGFAAPVEELIGQWRRGHLKDAPLINMLTGRPVKRLVDRDYVRRRKARSARLIASCPNPDRRERFEHFQGSPSMRRALNENHEAIWQVVEDLPDASRPSVTKILQRLELYPYFHPKPTRQTLSSRIASLGLPAQVRRTLFPHDIEVDLRAAHLSILSVLVGAEKCRAFVADCHAKDLSPWSIITEEVTPGLSHDPPPAGGPSVFELVRKQVKLLCQIKIYGAQYLKRPPAEYGGVPVEQLRERLTQHPILKELFGHIWALFKRCIATGSATLADGSTLEIPEASIGDSGDETLHSIRSQFSAIADRYECRAMNALYRVLRTDAAEHGRWRLRPRIDSHDGCSLARNRFDRTYEGLLQRAFRAAETELAQHGMVIRFDVAWDPRKGDQEMIWQRRAEQKGLELLGARQLGKKTRLN